MDAPLYPPATVFEQPFRVAHRVNTTDTAIADLRDNQAAWIIVQNEMPGIDARITNPLLAIHLGNFSFRSLVQFGLVQSALLDRIDEQLRTLPPTTGGAK